MPSSRFRLLAIIALMLAMANGSSVYAQENSPFLYCTTCHGADGNGNSRIGAPRISGMEPWYLRNQFRAFSEGWRGEHVNDDGGAEMRAVARILESPADLDNMVEYVESLVFDARPPTVDGNTERGAELYASCVACHGADAAGLEVLNAPGLAGQSDWYLAKSLNDYRNGIRGAHPDDLLGAQMRATVSVLVDEQDVNDVVAYIRSLGDED